MNGYNELVLLERFQQRALSALQLELQSQRHQLR